MTQLWYATLRHPKMHPYTKFEIPTSNNMRYAPDTIIFKTRSEVKVCDTPPSQDASTHQIWNSYLKEYRIYAQDTKRDGRMDGLTDGLTASAITICLPNFLWGHKKGEFFCQKLPLPVALVAVLRQCSGSVVVHSLFIIASFVCG